MSVIQILQQKNLSLKVINALYLLEAKAFDYKYGVQAKVDIFNERILNVNKKVTSTCVIA